MTLLVAFVATAFLSAGLLFSLEPMVGKLMLPLLGGSPAIWNTCLLFFQAMLLAGYAYVHFGIRLLGVRRHAVLHVALIAASLLLVPPDVGTPEPPIHGSPVGWLLLLLLRTIGLPFFVLSATAPLVQRWLAESAHPSGRDPYFLYAASNLGSLAGLMLYPFVLEPLSGLRAQALGWATVYVLFAALLATLAVRTRRQPGGRPGNAAAAGVPSTTAGTAAPVGAATAAVSAAGVTEAPPTAGRVAPVTAVRWTAIAFVPSALLLAVTGHVTTDVAPMPLLWLLPLSIYLATFVAAFAGRGEGLLPWARARQPVAVIGVGVAVLFGYNPVWMLPVHLAVLALAAWLGHARLAAERPPAAQLTAFYLWLSVGGTLGGVFGVLVAPVVFMPETEYALLLVASLLLPARATAPAAGVSRRTLAYGVGAAGVGFVVAMVAGDGRWAAAALVPALVVALRGLDARRELLAAGVAIGLVVALPVLERTGGRGDVIVAERNFFGTLRVRETEGSRRLMHGRTLHGAQLTDPVRALEPTTYYAAAGPLGDVFALLATRDTPALIGAVGLGVGTAACLGRPDDTWDMYEIDPAVVRVARDPELFTFLSACAPDAAMIIGDGRRALQLRDGVRYDLLILDAFSSDAIPAHLLTREAFALYAERLARDGVLAVHISNRYLDLAPVVAASGRAAGLAARIREDRGGVGGGGGASAGGTGSGGEVGGSGGGAARDVVHSASTWVALAHTEAPLMLLEALRPEAGWRRLEPRPRFRAWTDDYTNLLRVLRGGT
jgi:spermidine synthase